MMRTLSIGVAGCLFGLVGAGCATKAPPPIVPAKGIVLLDGKPLVRVEVRFFPNIEYGAEYIARGVTDEQGRFELKCNGQPGACVGENRVVITEAELPNHVKGENNQKERIKYLASLGPRPPLRYCRLFDSGLIVDVHAGQVDYSFDLEP